ncbi:MAG: cytochrome c-type biogenesis CcmF C-terminal domain-containing protein [Myxococcota bacterium]
MARPELFRLGVSRAVGDSYLRIVCFCDDSDVAQEMFYPAWVRAKQRGESFWSSLPRSIKGSRRRFSGYVVQLAIVVIVAAIASSQSYKFAVEASLTPGQSFEVGDYTLTYVKTQGEDHPHRFSVFALLDVTQGDKPIGTLKPRLNFYASQREPVGTPHVKTVGNSDLYTSLLSFERDGSRVAVKAFIIPMVPWIWWMLPVIAAGSIISLWPRRKLKRVLPHGATVSA